MQTAALLASGEPTDEAAIDTATIEAVWIFVMPMSLPLDARLPEEQIKHARQALARAKAVGEEYARRARRHGHGAHAARRVRDRRGGAPPRRRGDRARRRGTVADPRRRAPGGAGRAARELRRRHHQVRGEQGRLPGDRHRAGGPARRRSAPRRSSRLRDLSGQSAPIV